MLQIGKVPSMAIVRTVTRSNLTKPLNKGSVFTFIAPDENSTFLTINKFTTDIVNKFNIFGTKGIYHPHADFFYLNASCKHRFVNYKKDFTNKVQTASPQFTMIRTFPDQFNGLNYVYTAPYIFETGKGYARENKPEMVWSYYLEKFRRDIGIPTKFDARAKKEEILEGKNPYPERYMVFDLELFDIPSAAEINVIKSAKVDDPLRNFLYFLQYEANKYMHLLNGITFIFISQHGLIKLKLDDEYNITENLALIEGYTFSKNGSRIMYIEEAAKRNSTPTEVLNNSVKTLTILMRKIAPTPIVLSKEEEKAVEDTVTVDSTTPDNVEVSQVQDMKALDKAIETLPEEDQADLSDELLKIDADMNKDLAANAAVDAIISKVHDAKQEKIKVMSPKERGALNKMNNIEVPIGDKNKRIEDILKDEADMSIPPMNLPIESAQGYDHNSFHQYTDAYNSQLKNKDIVAAVTHFQDAEIPLYVDKITITDTSDPFNEVETVSTRFRDDDGNTFTVTVDLPKMYKGNRIKINSSEKVLVGQLTYLPILKIDDSVIITTNYNKIFMEKRYGNGLTPQANKLMRALKKMAENKDVHGVFFGDYSNANLSSKILSEEMKELSSEILAMGDYTPEFIRSADFEKRLKDDDIRQSGFFLSMYDLDVQRLHSLLAPSDIGNYTVIGFAKGTEVPILLDMDSSRISIPGMEVEDDTIYTAVLKLSDTYNLGIRPYYEDIKNVNKLTSTYIKIMNNWIPLIYILIYTDGLYTILEKLGVQYEIVPVEEKQRRANKEKEIKVELLDCTVYINIEDVASSILFYPLQDADLSMYTLADMEKPQHTASVLIDNTNGDINFPLYINTFRSCLIDPYTKEILAYLDQPTDFVGVFLYANNLLASPVNMDELSLNSCRIRYAEVIQAVYYKELANAYAEYAAKKKRGSKSATMSIPRDKVCTQVMALPNVEEYSRINPYQESVKRYSCNYKGHLGKNVSRAYTWKARSYHKSYVGSIGLPTAFSANIGINKQLTCDPKVKNLRGMFEVVDDPNTLASKNIVTSTEAITVGSATHSDAPRDAMNQAQKSHIIPVEGAETGYVTNSYDRSLAYMSDDFAMRAEDAGVVESVTDKYIVIKYNNGKRSAVKLKMLNKNSAKGKFVVAYMKPVVKVGQKVKANDVLAHDKDFFKYNDLEGFVATMGAVLNLIWKPEACVYEDSVVISETASKKLMNRAVKRVAARFHKNSKITDFKHLGEFVNADTPLITFVQGTEDDLMSEFLSNSEMSELDKKERTAHKAGEIFNIRMTYACDKSTMSSSVSKFMTTISKEILELNEEKQISTITDEFNKREFSELPVEVKGGHKMNGEIIEKDEILVEYFIEYPDFMGIGDKGSQFTALKGIVAKVVPDNEMPIGVDSGRHVDLICSPYSPGARKTFDVNHVFVQNCLMEKLTDIARETFLGKDYKKLFDKK